jgi:histidinol phosphatase-like PHP family hydrolase
VNSDAHSPRDILTPQWAEHVARCAGLPEELLETVLIANPQTLLGRARENLAKGGGA